MGSFDQRLGVLCLVLVLFAGVGGAVHGSALTIASADTQDTAEITVEDTVLEELTIADALLEETGEVSVLVSLTDGDAVEARQHHARASRQSLQAFARDNQGVTIDNTFWISNQMLLTVDTATVPLEKLANVDGVTAIQENAAIVPPTTTTVAQGEKSASDETALDSESVSYTWGLEQISAPAVWDAYDTRGEGTSVAVLDTGVDPDHPDIDLAEWAEFDGNGDILDSDPYDEGDHGTHVSGTVAGGDASGEHIGVAPETELYHGAVYTDNGGTLSAAIAGIEWAVENDVDVVTMSFGMGSQASALVEPIRNAEDAGTTVVASVGNSGDGGSTTPGNTYDGIGAGATDESAEILDFSGGEVISTDSWTDPPADWPEEYIVPAVTAPGVLVWSASPGGSWLYQSGTSMAAPHVAGAVALVQSALPERHSPTQIRDALEATAWKPDGWDEPAGERDTRYGAGIVDVATAIESLESAGSSGSVGLELNPEDATAEPGETVTYDVVITGATEGVDAYEYNISVDDPVAEIDGFTLDREGIGDSFVTDDNSTLVLEEALLDTPYEPAEEITVGTVEVTATGEFGESTALGFSVDAEDAVLDNSGDLYTVERTTGATLDIDGPPSFAVHSLEPAEATVTDGETVELSATVENTGGEGTETVSLSVGDIDASESLTLSHGESETMTFDVDTASLDPGDHEFSIASDSETASGTLTVLEPAEFVVGSLDAPTPVAGDSLAVTADIENVGEVSATQTVVLDIDGLGSTETSVELGGGDTTAVTLAVETETDDGGSYTASVTTEDDSASTSVTVDTPAEFAVSIDGANTPVAGDALAVETTVENVGDVAATRSLGLDAGTLGTNETAVALDGAQSKTVTMTVPTDEDSVGEYAVTVDSGDDSDSTAVDVLAPATFTVEIADTTEPTQGEAVSVTVAVSNVGDVEAEKPVALDVEGVASTETAISLGAGDSQEVTLAVDTDASHYGDYPATIEAGTAVSETTVEVHLPAFVENPPQDLTGDGLYEDIRGDGELTLFDVQTLFNQRHESLVTQNTEAFNFQGASPDRVTIFDIQTLFNRIDTIQAETTDRQAADERSVASPDEVELALDPTAESASTQAAVPGETLSYDVVITDPNNGVDAYEFDIAVEETAVAAVDAVTLDREGVNSVRIEAGNETVELAVALLDERYGPAAEVTVATVDVVVGETPGASTDITFDGDAAVLDGEDKFYNVAETTPATVTVTAEPSVPELPAGTPQDLTGDGLYEDILGTGELTIFDVQALFNLLGSDELAQYPTAFNFSGEDDPNRVTVADVQALFEQLVESRS